LIQFFFLISKIIIFFYLLTFGWLEIRFYDLFYMTLSMSRNSSHEFDGLTWVYLICFFLCLFFYPFLSFNFIIQLDLLEIELHIFFNLFFIKFSQSNDSDCEFNGLTRLTWVFFFLIDFFFQFNSLILG